MAATPIVPQFAFADSSITNLQRLSGASAFICQSPLGWHLYKTSGQSITANTATRIAFGTVAGFDPDGVSNGTGVTINTQAYYDVEATVPFSNTSSAGEAIQLWFQLTTGTGNPVGSGMVFEFGGCADLSTGSSDTMSLSCAGTTPACCYVNDVIEVWIKAAQAVTVTSTYGNEGNDIAGFPNGGPSFTGAFCCAGP